MQRAQSEETGKRCSAGNEEEGGGREKNQGSDGRRRKKVRGDGCQRESTELGSSCEGFPPTDVFPLSADFFFLLFFFFFYRNVIFPGLIAYSLPIPTATFTSNTTTAAAAAADLLSHVLPRLHNSSLPSPRWLAPTWHWREGWRERRRRYKKKGQEKKEGKRAGASLAEAMQRQYDANAT